MKKLFGSLEFCQVLTRLGFKAQRQQGTSHVKFIPPTNHKIPLSTRPFMIVQLSKRQFDKHTCSRYISELIKMGFDKKRIHEVLE